MKKLSTLFILMAMVLAAFADPDSFTVSVSGGNVFTISRSDASAAGWVEYYTQSGSAVAGIHYEDVAGRLDFAAGEYSKIVTVPLYSVASIDKFNIESGISRLFYFCIHNNSMANTPRSTGWWDDATVISASDISTTQAQKITDDISLGYNQYDFTCNSAMSDAFSGITKDYYTFSDQTGKYDFQVQMTFYTRSVSDDNIYGVGITLDGNTSEIGIMKKNYNTLSYYWDKTYIPSGLKANLCNIFLVRGFLQVIEHIRFQPKVSLMGVLGMLIFT